MNLDTIDLDLPESLGSILSIQYSFTPMMSREQRDNMMLCIITTKSVRSCRKQVLRLRRQDRKIYGYATAKQYEAQTIIYSVDKSIRLAKTLVREFANRLESESLQLSAI